MLMAGKNIRLKNDNLQKITVERLYQSIVNPQPNILSQINQLRTILTIDPNRYRQLKTALPYITCGLFSPPFRRTENFGSILNYILDIDHLSDKKIDIQTLKRKLETDPRIELIFISPGNNGLKLFFRFSEKCYDPAKYSLFYKVFAHAFSKQYNLQQVIDKSTSDVSRACFISCDENAYYNQNPETVSMSAFVNFDNLAEVRETQKAIVEQEKTNTTLPKQQQNIPQRELTPDLLDEIKKKLKPNIRLKKEKNIFVPHELETIIENVKQSALEYGIEVKDIVNIHYGKKFTFGFETRWAETNIFYGKKGYTVVKSPKGGSDKKLMEIVYTILCELFY